MMKKYDAIIIGAGPSGIFSAITIARQNKKVLLIEKNNILGKKLLIAGQGRCNLTNGGDLKSFMTKYGANGKFLKTALHSFTPQDLIKWFEERGLPLTLIEETGKYFPHTMKSQDVVDLLESECIKLGVEIKKGCLVREVSKNNDLFEVKTSGANYTSTYLIISTGGKSYESTGTTGDGYTFAKSFGHNIIEPVSALAPVHVENYPFEELSGISFKNLPIKLLRNNKIINETSGDILFTHKNLSGPGIIDFSRYVRRGDTLQINFLNYDKNKFEQDILEYTQAKGKNMLKTFLSTYKLQERFQNKMFELLGLAPEKKVAELSREERKKLCSLCEYEFVVSKVAGFDFAMATAGGVDLKEVNPKTMESKLVPNLYFVGEVLDIDGDTGGYNIQAAFSMGYLVGRETR